MNIIQKLLLVLGIACIGMGPVIAMDQESGVKRTHEDDGREEDAKCQRQSDVEEVINLDERLFTAAENGDLNQVISCLELGAQVDASDAVGRTPLHVAVLYGNIAIVKYLVEHKANINAKDEDVYTPLHLAAGNGHTTIVQYLVGQNADINVSAKIGLTPLHMAAYEGYIDIVTYLVEQGADITALTNSKLKSVQKAAQKNRSVCQNYLINVENYFNNNTVVTNTGQDQATIPHYCLLAVLKNNPYDVAYYFDPNFDYSHYIKNMRLPQGTPDNGIYELVWNDLKRKEPSMGNHKPVESMIVKNTQGLKVLVQYNLYKKVTSTDIKFRFI